MEKPSGLKKISVGTESCAEVENNLTKVAVDTLKAVDSVYWFTSSPLEPLTYIFNPSGLMNNPAGVVSSPVIDLLKPE